MDSHLVGSMAENGHVVNGCSDQQQENGLVNGVEVAYQANLKAHRQGISTPEVIKAYDAWADYDKDLCPGVYNGPAMAANALHAVLSPQDGVRVLDVAAGTGRVGLELHQRGFR
ncbi:hypothetical protein B566_EDAN009496 [Ephemera danica]|nr:hypothetical protein B566_EDAN009496 [Ephemera danica]